MPGHIGIVACSAEGAALCFRTICIEAAHRHPEVTMHCHPLETYMRHIRRGDWDGVAELMLSSAEKLARAGADFAICPDNTIHEAFDRVAGRSPVPWLHIAAEVASEARRRGYRRLGVLGTRYLMEGPVYGEKLSALGIEHRIPDAGEREEINAIIFDELVNGRLTSRSRACLAGVIRRLKNSGCDAAVLGCTELPLLVSQEDSALPTLDSTRLLARAALRRALA